MLITESHDDDHGLLTMYDSTNDILIALKKKKLFCYPDILEQL